MLLSYAYGTVEDIEIVWSVLAFVGLVLSLLNSRDAYGDWKFLRRKGVTNGRLMIAKVNFQTESMRAAIQAIFLVIGLLAMFLAAAPTSQLTPIQLALAISVKWGLIVSSVLLTTKTIILRRLRKAIVEDH